MYLRYYLDEQGKRVYTFKVTWVFDNLIQYHDADDKPTISAHPGKLNFWLTLPARFSPDDQYSA
jgi:rRNA maturation protein Nop10